MSRCTAPGCYGGVVRDGGDGAPCHDCGGTGSAAVQALAAAADEAEAAEVRREGVAAEWRDKADPSGM